MIYKIVVEVIVGVVIVGVVVFEVWDFQPLNTGFFRFMIGWCLFISVLENINSIAEYLKTLLETIC